MKVLKVELEGITASFRYPHFLVGRQPSYPMPPPATIYGHVCSAVGDYIDPASFSFACYFTYQGKGDDVESIYQTTPGSGKIIKQWGEINNVELNMNPYLREILLFPRLTLYIDSPEGLQNLYNAFRSPRYPVILGRSQDMAGYRRVDVIELEKASYAYFEGTLLPACYAMRTGAGVSVTMPRFINQEDRKNVLWERYVVLEKRVFLTDEEDKRANIMLRPDENEEVWVDPETPEVKGLRRAVVWHSFCEEEDK